MKKISEIILSYVESIEEKDILEHENHLLYRIYSLILVYGSVLNVIYFTLFHPQNPNVIVVNSICFVVTALCFIIVGRYGKNEMIKVHIFNLLFLLVLTFFVIRYYSYIGPSVWNVAFVFIVFSIIRMNKSMLVVIMLTILFLALNTWYRVEPFELGMTYYIAQLVTLALLFWISSFAHDMNKQRKDRMLEQLQTIKSSKYFIQEVNTTLEKVNTALEEEIQEHMITQRYLSASEEKFRSIFEGSADPVIIVVNKQIIDCNVATIEMLEYKSKEDIIGKFPWDISPDIQPDGEKSEMHLRRTLELFNGKDKVKFEWWYEKSNGRPFVVEVMLTNFVLNGEDALHILWRDISERKQLEEELVYLSYHDQLTGLYNRRYFEEELKRLDTPRNLPISLVFADVNNLKRTNDSLGHYIGDELLKNISRILKTECRADDIIARLGGDEFIIILPKTEAQVAIGVINRLKSLISTEEINDMALSVAFGIATKEKEEHEILEVLKKAELYMYENKLHQRVRDKEESIIL